MAVEVVQLCWRFGDAATVEHDLGYCVHGHMQSTGAARLAEPEQMVAVVALKRTSSMHVVLSMKLLPAKTQMGSLSIAAQ